MDSSYNIDMVPIRPTVSAFLFALAAPISGTLLSPACGQIHLPHPPAAQEQPHGPGPAIPTLLKQVQRSGWLHMNIANGRIVPVSIAIRDQVLPGNSVGFKERMTFSSANGQPAVAYEGAGATERLSIRINEHKAVSLKYTPPADTDLLALDFDQPQDGPLMLTIGSGDRARSYRGATLWHLILELSEPERKQFAERLELLRPDWRLSERAAEIEETLVREALTGQFPDPKRWEALIAQLGDDLFSHREAADRELRAAGPAVVSYLQQLDFSNLDAEQQFRVRRILAWFAHEGQSDRVDSIASRLLCDPVIWLTLCTRPQEATRRAAAARLSRLLAGPLDFDPTAAANVRQAQIEKLRTRLLHN